MHAGLINAALKNYALYGYHGATMKKIADEVGIKPASIYFFYKNKEELFIAAFKQLLDRHFQKMESIFLENQDEPVEQIFTEMIHGIVSHHAGDMQGTNAYISLVTAPIDEISQYLHHHMQRYNSWLTDTLQSSLRKSYPQITAAETDRILKQFVLVGNGVFWGIKLYEGKDLEEQVMLAIQILQALFDELNKKYCPRDKK